MKRCQTLMINLMLLVIIKLEKKSDIGAMAYLTIN